jgi:uncharacterized protein YggU (UPF0235/DUF167 family)
VARGTAVIGEGAQGGESRLKQVLIEGDADQLAPLIEAKLAKLAER